MEAYISQESMLVGELDNSAVIGHILREAKCKSEFSVKMFIRNKLLLSTPMEKKKKKEGARQDRAVPTT